MANHYLSPCLIPLFSEVSRTRLMDPLVGSGVPQGCLHYQVLPVTKDSNYLHSARLRQLVGVQELHTSREGRRPPSTLNRDQAPMLIAVGSEELEVWKAPSDLRPEEERRQRGGKKETPGCVAPHSLRPFNRSCISWCRDRP